MSASEASAGLVSVPTSGQGPDWRTRVADRRSGLDCFERGERSRLANLRAHVGFAARAQAVDAKRVTGEQCHMVTLTYADANGWQARQISDALRAFRRWCKDNGVACRYVWVAEIQDGTRRADGEGRGAIHYHIATWLPAHLRVPYWDAAGWWPHGMSNHVRARHAVAYLMHYLKKDKDYSAMPKGARAYGVGGLEHALRRARRWLRLPAAVQGNSSISDRWERARGGGWRSPEGVHFRSEFERVWVAGVWLLRRACTHERRIDASGPFSWWPGALA